jgi:hypothetical protein
MLRELTQRRAEDAARQRARRLTEVLAWLTALAVVTLAFGVTTHFWGGLRDETGHETLRWAFFAIAFCLAALLVVLAYRPWERWSAGRTPEEAGSSRLRRAVGRRILRRVQTRIRVAWGAFPRRASRRYAAAASSGGPHIPWPPLFTNSNSRLAADPLSAGSPCQGGTGRFLAPSGESAPV